MAACGQTPDHPQPETSIAIAEDKDASGQTTLCEVDTWQRIATAAACKPGEKVVFLPKRWGNDQLPVIFAAINCDMRYAVAMTSGAVTCIYAPIKVEEEPQSTTSPDTNSEQSNSIS